MVFSKKSHQFFGRKKMVFSNIIPEGIYEISEKRMKKNLTRYF
jgi:hypothetical protein